MPQLDLIMFVSIIHWTLIFFGLSYLSFNAYIFFSLSSSLKLISNEFETSLGFVSLSLKNSQSLQLYTSSDLEFTSESDSSMVVDVEAIDNSSEESFDAFEADFDAELDSDLDSANVEYTYKYTLDSVEDSAEDSDLDSDLDSVEDSVEDSDLDSDDFEYTYTYTYTYDPIDWRKYE